MNIVINYLHDRGFNLLIVDKDRFLMKKGSVCVLHQGNDSYEIFKHAFKDVCYSFVIRKLKDPIEIIKKTDIVNGL